MVSLARAWRRFEIFSRRSSASLRAAAALEKLGRLKDAEEDVAKRVFEWPRTPGAGAIKIIYHYGDDRVTASFRRLGSGLG